MNDKQTQNAGQEGRQGGAGAPKTATTEPEWASGLRRLYDQVVSEPLPDQFKDLLSKLDEPRK